MYSRFGKRIFDLLVSIFALMFISPLFIVIGLIIKFDSRGPIIFKQKRITKSTNEFYIYKFRTMVINADKIGSYSTQIGDPRITKVGKFLRKSSLDEIPQLINVLFGNMSLIGPRPDVPAQRKLYTEEEWSLRHMVCPGITGLAQAKIRSQGTEKERKELDLKYVQQINPWLDMKILYWTVRQVIGKGSF